VGGAIRMAGAMLVRGLRGGGGSGGKGNGVVQRRGGGRGEREGALLMSRLVSSFPNF